MGDRTPNTYHHQAELWECTRMLRMKRERPSRTHWRTLLLKQLGEKDVIKEKKKQTPKPRETKS